MGGTKYRTETAARDLDLEIFNTYVRINKWSENDLYSQKVVKNLKSHQQELKIKLKWTNDCSWKFSFGFFMHNVCNF